MPDQANATAFTVASAMLHEVEDALTACSRAATSAYVIVGQAAWDDPCGQLVVAIERAYMSGSFPNEGVLPYQDCYDGEIVVALVCVLVRCMPTLDNSGEPPSPEEISDATALIYNDAAIVWNALADGAPEGWSATGLNQTFVGAEGGAVGIETRITLGINAEAWCPECIAPTP